MSDFLTTLRAAPEGLLTAASRRAYALNEGYRALVGDQYPIPHNYAVWLAARAEGFVQDEDYPVVDCRCDHAGMAEGAASRGAPFQPCGECDHLVRFSFTGRATHCEPAHRTGHERRHTAGAFRAAGPRRSD